MINLNWKFSFLIFVGCFYVFIFYLLINDVVLDFIKNRMKRITYYSGSIFN